MTAPRKGKPLSFLAGSSRVARMTRIQWMLGVVVTIIVTLLAVTGNLRSIEQPPFDWRSGLFAKNAPSPSNTSAGAPSFTALTRRSFAPRRFASKR